MFWVPVLVAWLQEPGGAVYGWEDRSGARIQVRTLEGAQVAALHLVVGTGGWAESRERHGFRHLLEHLVALGPERDLDRKLEAVGGGLTADTYRDASHFRIWGPAKAMGTLVAALAELLRPPMLSEALIRRELEVLREEEELRDSESLAGGLLWQMAFGEAGLDPFGDLETMGGASPEQLQGLWSALFAGRNLVLVACVPDRPQEWADEIRRRVSWPRGDRRASVQRREARPFAWARSDRLVGEYRAAPVRGLDSEETAEALAAALLLSSKLDGGRVLYTPSDLPSLVIVGETRSSRRLAEAWQKALDGWRPADGAAAAQWAARWLESQLEDPLRAGLWYGVATVQGRASAPDDLLQRLRGLSSDAVRRGLERFGADKAYLLTGEGR
jgi:predicted Zn-dependent peptidase